MALTPFCEDFEGGVAGSPVTTSNTSFFQVDATVTFTSSAFGTGLAATSADGSGDMFIYDGTSTFGDNGSQVFEAMLRLASGGSSQSDILLMRTGIIDSTNSSNTNLGGPELALFTDGSLTGSNNIRLYWAHGTWAAPASTTDSFQLSYDTWYHVLMTYHDASGTFDLVVKDSTDTTTIYSRLGETCLPNSQYVGSYLFFAWNGNTTTWDNVGVNCTGFAPADDGIGTLGAGCFDIPLTFSPADTSDGGIHNPGGTNALLTADGDTTFAEAYSPDTSEYALNLTFPPTSLSGQDVSSVELVVLAKGTDISNKYALSTIDSAITLSDLSSPITIGSDHYVRTEIPLGSSLSPSETVAWNSAIEGGGDAWTALVMAFGSDGDGPFSGTRVTYAALRVCTTPRSNNAHCGDKVAKYTVTEQTSLPYTVSPNGPADDVHFGKFKIAEVRTVSFMASLASDNGQDFYVQPLARFLTWTGSTFTTLSYQSLGSPVHLTGDTTWSTITRIANAPTGATHWALDFSVEKDAGGAAPDVGTVLYLDCVYIPDNGLDVAAEPYLDGDQVGTIRGDGRWEGTPHDSTSVWGALTPDPGTDPPPTDPGGDGGGSDADPDPSTEPDTGGDQPPPPPAIAPVLDIAAGLVSNKVSGRTFCLDADVQLGDLLFNTIDEFGCFWAVEDIDGWWNLPDPDIPDITRGIDDGSYETRGRYSARIFTLTGSFWPASSHDVRTARDRLVRAMNLCHYGAWFATHEVDATRASKVWLSGRPSVATTTEAGRTDFSIGLKAPDPVKYGLFNRVLPGWNTSALRSSSSTADFGRVYDRSYEWAYPTVPSGGVLADSVNITNEGNVRVSPVLIVYGPTLGPIDIHNETTNQVMRVRLGLQPDDTLVIDCQNRTVTLNGVTNQRYYLDTITDWIYLDPGHNKFTYTEETGSSNSFITVQWRSGWIG